MRILLAAVFSGLLVSFVGCADGPVPPAGAAEIINTHCPIMGSEVDPEMTVDYEGKKVAFCCPPCLDEWAEMSAEEKKAALEKAASGGGHEGHADHGDHADHADHGEGEGHKETEDASADESADTSEAATEEEPTEPVESE